MDIHSIKRDNPHENMRSLCYLEVLLDPMKV